MPFIVQDKYEADNTPSLQIVMTSPESVSLLSQRHLPVLHSREDVSGLLDASQETKNAVTASVSANSPSLALSAPSVTVEQTRGDSRDTDLRDVRYGSIVLLSPWFPEVDPTNKRARTWRTWHSRQDVLLVTATIISGLVFIANLSATSYISIEYRSIGEATFLHEADCSFIKNLDTGLHVLINILSTLLLGASNLCMQILAAPSRQEIDRAHAKHTWLDIGVPSWRNLRSIDAKRRIVWWCLALSSVPIHFLYNAIISSSLPSYSFGAAFVTEDFVHGAAWNQNVQLTPPSGDPFPYLHTWPDVQIWNQTEALVQMQLKASKASSMVNRTKTECLEIYSDMYGPRTNLLVVLGQNSTSDNASLLSYLYLPASRFYDNPWLLCGSLSDGACHSPKRITEQELGDWTLYDRSFLYCLTEAFLAVSGVNAFKFMCIILTTYYFSKSRIAPLCTLGDAIASFLETPDTHTTHMGIVSQVSATDERFWLKDRVNRVIWQAPVLRWYTAATTRRWVITMLLCLAATIAAVTTMASGAHGTMTRMALSYSSVLKLPFGGANSSSFTGYFLPKTGSKGFIANVIWANYWQIIISVLYLAYNGLLSTQLVSEEWAGYIKDRKPLRVSHPKGIQRSSYFVSMPLKYGIPLMACLSTIHFLVSLSTFVVDTTAYYPNLIEDTDSSFTTTGYSISASLTSIIFGLVVLIALILNSFRTLPKGMPLAATCSAAISAACHPPPEDCDAHLLPVQWGFIPDSDVYDEHSSSRCTFTTHRNVQPPIDGKEYIGISSWKSGIPTNDAHRWVCRLKQYWKDLITAEGLKRWWGSYEHKRLKKEK